MDPRLCDLQIELITADHTVVGNLWNDSSLKQDPFARLYLVTGGEGWMEVNEGALHLEPGHIHLIPSYTPYRFLPSPALTKYWIHFSTSLKSDLSLFDLLKMHPVVRTQEVPGAEEHFIRLMTLISDNSPAAQLEIQARIRLLLLPFVEEWREDAGTRLDSARRLEPILSFMQENLKQEQSVESLARRAHLHPNYFSALFRESVGMPPKQYLQRKRIEAAQLLLKTGEASIPCIAAQVGYPDVCYFSRIFRKVTGLPPGGYRQLLRQTPS